LIFFNKKTIAKITEDVILSNTNLILKKNYWYTIKTKLQTR
jgi:hypothetical protein